MTILAEYYCAGCHSLLGGVSLYGGGQVYHPQCVPRTADTECPECEAKDKRIAKLEEELAEEKRREGGEVSGECDDPKCEVCRDIYGPHLTVTQGEDAAYYRAECPECKNKAQRISELEAENAGLRSHQACTRRAEKAETALESVVAFSGEWDRMTQPERRDFIACATEKANG